MTERLFAVPSQPRCVATAPADLLTAYDAEADALADRLHDGALQALVVARYATDAAVRGGDPALARDAVQEALVALRRMVWLLRPRGEDDLPAALAELSGRAAAAGAPALELDVDAATAARLSPAARAAAYRFVQAAVADGGFEVRLCREGAQAALTVTDGVLAEAAGWAARAEVLGGRLDSPRDPARLLLPLMDDDPEGDR